MAPLHLIGPVRAGVRTSTHLCVCVEHFDPLGGDEEVHLCHGLGLTFWSLLRHTHRPIHTVTEKDTETEQGN